MKGQKKNMPRKAWRSKSRGRKENDSRDIQLFVNTDEEGKTKRKMAQRSTQAIEDAKMEKKGEPINNESGSQKSKANLVVPWNKAQSKEVDKKAVIKEVEDDNVSMKDPEQNEG